MSGSEEFTLDAALRRIAAVRERIRRAAERAGRDPSAVALVAVSKTVPASAVLAAAEAGLRVFGESRVQEASAKVSAVRGAWAGDPLTWRMVGHVQRNKVKLVLRVFDTVDSVDSVRLLEAIAESAERDGRRVPILLEFNCSGDATKSGFDPGEWAAVAGRLGRFAAVDLRGLMTIGPLEGGAEAARPAFRKLREIGERMQDVLGSALPELSMGMSDDLEVGVEEGATLVRVGTAIFGSRPA